MKSAKAPARLQIHFLGEPAAWFEGVPWRIVAPPKVYPLLALLTIACGPVQRAALGALLWPDESPAAARANLRRHLHALSKALPPSGTQSWILTDAHTIEWNRAASSWVDVVEFLDAVERDDRRRAVDLYRGEFVAGNFDEAILIERERLQTAYVEALVALAQTALLDRDYAGARAAGETMLTIDEWREDAVRIVMQARYLAGDRSGALATYERFAERLQTEVRALPTRETAALRETIASGAPLHEHIRPGSGPATTTPLVGREAILGQLRRHWQQATRGSGYALFVSGQAGIGKTRLVQELIAEVRSTGGHAVCGRTANPESSQYQPVAEALRALAPAFERKGDDDWLSALHPLLPESVAFRMSDANERVPELRLQDAVIRYIERCARRHPIAIVLEDLHLARPGTIELAAALAARVSSLPLLLILTYRMGEAPSDGPLLALRDSCMRRDAAAHIELEPLACEHIERLVEQQLPEAKPHFAQRVFAISSGNPLFAWQLIHARNERAEASDERHDLTAAILDRVRLLDAQTRAVADVAATIGDSFTVEEIAEVGGWPEHVADASIRELLSRQLVGERAGIAFEYAFAHAAIARAIYDATPPDARNARHRRAAEVLSLTRAEQGFDHALVAEHWLRAGHAANARHWFAIASKGALRGHARSDALLFARRILELDPPDDERFEALLTVVRCSFRVQTRQDGLHALAELRALGHALCGERDLQALAAAARFASECGDRDAQVAAVEALATRAATSTYPRWQAQASLELATLALQRGEAVGAQAALRDANLECLDEPARIHAYATLAQALYRQTRFDDGDAVLAELRRFLDTHQDVDGELAIADARTIAAWVMESPAQLRAAASLLVSLAQARGDLLNEARGRGYLAYVKNQLHDTCGARTEYERIIEIYERAEHHQNLLITRTNYAMVEFGAGHIDRAEYQWRLVEARASSNDRVPETLTLAVSINIGAIELHRGEVASALKRGRFVYEVASRSGEAWLLANAAGFYGEALCANGEFDRGLALLGDAIARTAAMGRNAVEPRTGYLEALIAHRRVDELARTYATLAEEFERDPLDQLYPARTCTALAQAAMLLGERDEHNRWVRRAREVIEERVEAFGDLADRTAYARSPFNAGFRINGACTYA